MEDLECERVLPKEPPKEPAKLLAWASDKEWFKLVYETS